MPNFAAIALPLWKRLPKSKTKDIEPVTEEELYALKALMKKLISPPILTLSKNNGRYTLDTDAFDRQIGDRILQK